MKRWDGKRSVGGWLTLIMERRSQPTPMAMREPTEENMPSFTPWTEKTMAIAPNTDSCGGRVRELRKRGKEGEDLETMHGKGVGGEGVYNTGYESELQTRDEVRGGEAGRVVGRTRWRTRVFRRRDCQLGGLSRGKGRESRY